MASFRVDGDKIGCDLIQSVFRDQLSVGSRKFFANFCDFFDGSSLHGIC